MKNEDLLLILKKGGEARIDAEEGEGDGEWHAWWEWERRYWAFPFHYVDPEVNKLFHTTVHSSRRWVALLAGIEGVGRRLA